MKFYYVVMYPAGKETGRVTAYVHVFPPNKAMRSGAYVEYDVTFYAEISEDEYNEGMSLAQSYRAKKKASKKISKMLKRPRPK